MSESGFTGLKDVQDWGPHQRKSRNLTNHSYDSGFAIVLIRRGGSSLSILRRPAPVPRAWRVDSGPRESGRPRAGDGVGGAEADGGVGVLHQLNIRGGGAVEQAADLLEGRVLRPSLAGGRAHRGSPAHGASGRWCSRRYPVFLRPSRIVGETTMTGMARSCLPESLSTIPGDMLS